MTKSYKKICPKCVSQNTKKDGKRKGRQSYRCICGYVRISPPRQMNKGVICQNMYQDFAYRSTYQQLSIKYSMCVTYIQQHLDKYELPLPDIPARKSIVLLIDTTYFRGFGCMVFKDVETKKIVHFRIVKYETNDEYRKGIKIVQQEGRTIQAIVCDGRRGLLGGFGNIPTQMCQFHMSQIMRRKITKNPRTQANKDLKKIYSTLTKTNRSTFEYQLQQRHTQYKDYLSEKTLQENGKSRFTHRNTRSAYYSLIRHMEYLFVYQDHADLAIPNTTNALEGLFSHIKPMVNLHRGLSLDRKIKLLTYLLLSR